MSIRESSTINTTVTSSSVGSPEDSKLKVKDCVKNLLKSRIFLGRYTERRLVNQRIGYRDIVVLSPAEVDLKRDFLEAQNQLQSFSNSIWIGITDTEVIGHNSSGVCLWTEIDNQPFGPFWFQIRTVKFRDEEVIVTLKCLRHISDAFLEIEPLLTKTNKRIEENSSNAESRAESTSLTDAFGEITDTLKTALTITNIKEFITFICALVIALFTGSTAFINFVGNFVLALIREMSIFTKNATPLMLGFLDFLSKIVGGFYILVAMIFKPSNPHPSSKRSLTQYESSRYPNYEYDPRNFD